MLGDNRDNSRDSRYFGLVSKESLIGRVRYVFISLNPDHRFMPRWSRTLKALA
jgi:signal peptidase I